MACEHCKELRELREYDQRKLVQKEDSIRNLYLDIEANESEIHELESVIAALKAELEQLKKEREWFIDERFEIGVLADMDNTCDWENATTALKEIQDMVLLPPKNPNEEG